MADRVEALLLNVLTKLRENIGRVNQPNRKMVKVRW